MMKYGIGMAAFGALVVSVLAGCSMNPGGGSSSYKPGELGNGSFLFRCDDSVSCDRWSGSAQTFPEQVASGSNFELRFIAKNDQGTKVDLNGADYPGATIHPIGPYVGRGTKGFAAVKPGIATLAAKDASGQLIDYVTVRVVAPDGLALIDANRRSDAEPPRLVTADLSVGDRRELMAVAEYQKEAIAGAIKVEWSSNHPEIVQIESYTRGVANIVAKGAGKATLTASGGGTLTNTIEVEVK